MAERRQKGTGSVWKDKNKNIYHGEMQIGYLPNGNKKMRRVSGKTAKEVKQKLKNIEAEMIKNELAVSTNATVPEIARYLAEDKLKSNLIKISTYNRIIASIAVIEKTQLKNIPVSKVTEEIIKASLQSLTGEYSDSVMKKAFAVIKSSLKEAVRKNYIAKNPCDDITRPKSSKKTREIKSLTVEEEKQLIAALNKENKEPYRTMLLLSLLTGMRAGEILALKTTDISKDYQRIVIERTLTMGDNDTYVVGEDTKTGAGMREISVIPYVSNLLKNYIDNFYIKNKENLLFVQQSGKIYGVQYLNQYYKKIIKNFNINDGKKIYTLHQLRHTYGTRCAESGMSIKVLQKKMGHSDIKITLNIYADVLPNFESQEDEKYTSYLAKNSIIGE